jgi:peptide/nickel transport system substrate-binding protein
MGIDNRRLDALRSESSELENHYVDELVAGRLGRRSFLRRGAVVGMSGSVMGAVLAACGGANSSHTSAGGGSGSGASGAPIKGGTLRLAQQVPAAAVNPLTIADQGGANLLAQVGDFLVFDNSQAGHLQPMLATSWTHNGAGTVWTFKLRQGVKFHDGSPMTADDVVYTFQQQSDPKNAANALSTFANVLKPDGVRKVDDSTVAFHLESAVGTFPYIISSDNYNMIIVPKGTDFSKWQQTFTGTGPFKLKSYSQNNSASFVANPDYWGGPPHLASTTFTLYGSQSPQILALQGGSVDVIGLFTASGAQALLNSSTYNIIKVKGSSHRELSMRNDQTPFTDPRVRQAIALSLDRPAMVSALLSGTGVVGNDSPFAPKYPFTDTSVPQRVQDIAKAKQLLAAAGHPNGFSTTLFTEQFEEIPQLAQVIAASASKIGVHINLKVETQDAYYGKATYGNSDWLDGSMSLVDYNDRGVPNVYLEAAYEKSGPWDAARFNNSTFDKLVAQFIAAVDLQTQTTLAGKIETLLLDQTPIVIPYFLDLLTATTKQVAGTITTAAAIFLKDAYKT